MRLPDNELHHLSTVTHQGRTILFGVEPSRAIHYRVKHEPPNESLVGYELTAGGLARLLRALKEQGFDLAGRLDSLVGRRFADEAAYLEAVTQKLGDADTRRFRGDLLKHARVVEPIHWSDWQLLPLPHEAADESVVARERAERLDGLVASVYDTLKSSAIAPVQAVSEGAHLYLFRQSLAGTLLVDRFVLDAGSGRLSRTIEVRYKRSGKRHTPLRAATAKELDSRDFRDSNGNFFLEPSVELRLLDRVEGGRFAVALTPTHEHDTFRWHVFAWDAAGKRLRIVTLRKTAEAPFDLRDWTVVEGDAERPTYRQIPGIVRRSVELRDAQGRVLEPRGRITAVVHDLQREIAGDDGETHLVKVERRVFVAVPAGADGKIAAFSFALHRDGSLAPIDPAHQDRLLVEHALELQLPANTLDRLETCRDAIREPAPASARRGVVFCGGDQRVQTRVAPPLVGTSFTIELWMRYAPRGSADLALGQGVPQPGRGLHIGPCGDVFRFCFHHADALDTPLADAGWHHWACVYTLNGARQIFRDGVKVAEDTPSARYAGEGELTLGSAPWGYPFVGELSDVRVWRRARTEAEIKATMNNRLTGRELGLVAHWPLDAIVDGAVFNTVAQVPGVVVGAAYRGGRVLSRTLADGVNLVDRYRDSTLVPIAERATYIESFELMTDGSCAAFDVVFWGETVGGQATAPVAVPAQLEPLPGGWQRATARFTAQPGMTRLRTLEFFPPGGGWSRLDVRNHKLAQLRDTITDSTSAEVVTLTELGPEFADLVQVERDIDGHDAREAELYRRLRELDDTLARTPDELTSAVERRRQALAAADQELAARAAERDLMERNITYGGAVALCATNPAYKAFVCVEGTGVNANRTAIGPWETLKIENSLAPEGFSDVVRYGDWVAFRAHTGKYLIADNPTWPSTHYYWVAAVYPHIGAYERFQILNPDDLADTGPVPRGGKLAFKTIRGDFGQKFVLCGTAGPWWQKMWCEHDGLHPDGRFSVVHLAEGPAVEGARQRHGDALTRRNQCQADLDAAQRVLADACQDRALVQAERDRVAAELVALQTTISGEVTRHLAATRAIDAAELTMPRLTDPARPLVVQGALLGFARTAGDPTALESFEGAVHLYFAGTEGRLRRCVYDAVAQRWRADIRGTCLRLRGDGVVTIPHHPAFAADNFTIEMWVRSRGAGTDVQFLTARAYEEFEIHTGGRFADGLRFIPLPGIYVDTDPGALPRGEWAHVACVYAGDPGTAQIYINGKLATRERADTKKPRQPSSAPLLLGRRSDGSFGFSGDMAEVRLWNVALTADEIAAHMHLAPSGHEPGLVGYWPLRDGDGATASDRSTSGQHGTIAAGSWYPSTAPIGRQSTGRTRLLDFARAGTVTIPHSPAYALPTFTLEMRFRWTGSGEQVDFLFGKGPEELELHTGGAASNGLRFIPVPGVYIDTPADSLRPGEWVHVACVYTGDPAAARVHIDGVAVACHVTRGGEARPPSGQPLRIGSRGGGEYPFSGQIAEVRLWSVALSLDDIVARRHSTLTGQEPGLVGYWPLDDGDGGRAADRSPAGNHGAIAGPRFVPDAVVRLFPGAGAVIAGEYGSVEGDDGQTQALLRRFVAWPENRGVEVLLGQRVDTLELRWLGNAQMKPTLVGYIEGPPPVPSENLTVKDDYNGASSVEFKVAESTSSTFTHDLSTGVDYSLEAALGFYLGGSIGVAFIADADFDFSVSAMYQGKLAAGVKFLNQYSVTGSATVTTSETLTLKGEREKDASIARLGPRFLPKNVGYATVVSTLADVFVLRTRGGKRMVGYRVAPVKDIPPDVNVITFMINPAYTLNGSLDGQVGTSAADARFYGHVPEARAQFGSELPASYYRLREAYALKDAIDRANRSAEAIAINLRADILDGLTIDTSRPTSTDRSTVERQTSAQAQTTTDAASAAMSKLSPQRRLEQVIDDTPKGNIVNSYVWDGDGGLRVQTQTFATAWQNVLGGAISAEVGVGQKLSVEAPTIGAEFTSMLSFNLTETLTNTTAGSRAIELNVTVDCERQGITDLRDRPLLSGEKVDRYRFMSFALQPATDHFVDFFARVVDPEWLASNDEEALVLRQIDQGTPNKTWRVLHRVTYVERPFRVG